MILSSLLLFTVVSLTSATDDSPKDDGDKEVTGENHEGVIGKRY